MSNDSARAINDEASPVSCDSASDAWSSIDESFAVIWSARAIASSIPSGVAPWISAPSGNGSISGVPGSI